jgi:TorA maturation chaperone TorD
MSIATTTPETANEAALDLATETLYRFLSAALADPNREPGPWEVVLHRASQHLACQAADVLRGEFAERAIALGFGELPAEELDLRPLLRELSDLAGRIAAEHVRVFGLVNCRECPPYETEYCTVDDAFYRSQQMADVAGFYRAFGVEPTRLSERPDHLVQELEFEALLLLKKRMALEAARVDPSAEQKAGVCQDARAKFFKDHVSWWLPSLAVALRRKAQQGFYSELGRILAAFAPVERARLGVAAPPLPLVASVVAEPEGCSACAAADCRA